MVRRHYEVLLAVSRSYPSPQGKLPRVTLPCAAVHSTNHSEEIKKELLARLACLIHAANVHSEPGSNPSYDCFPVSTPSASCFSSHRQKPVEGEPLEGSGEERVISREKPDAGCTSGQTRAISRIPKDPATEIAERGPPTKLSKNCPKASGDPSRQTPLHDANERRIEPS